MTRQNVSFKIKLNLRMRRVRQLQVSIQITNHKWVAAWGDLKSLEFTR